MVKIRGNERLMFYGANGDTFKKAEALRENMTKSELYLWEYLKENKLLGLRFKRQHPISQFIVDFYCHKVKLVIEIDGEIHNIIENREYDENRTHELEKFQLTVIRFTNDEVFNKIDFVIETIKTFCQNKLL